jgi:hypothetical protein
LRNLTKCSTSKRRQYALHRRPRSGDLGLPEPAHVVVDLAGRGRNYAFIRLTKSVAKV